MPKTDAHIRNIDNVICRHIASTNFSPRGAVAQDVLTQLRNFAEHIMLKFYADGQDIDNTYDNTYRNTRAAIEYVKTRGDLRIMYRFTTFCKLLRRIIHLMRKIQRGSC